MPSPGPDTVIYGGNTSCLEIRADERLVIVDLGTGVRPLGEWLMKNDYIKFGKIEADIFITHTHWDHIMGLPMFSPVYVPGSELRIRASSSLKNNNIKSIIEAQLSHQYWPVSIEELSAKIEYNHMRDETLDLGNGLIVTSKFLNHPCHCLGYRFYYQGKSIATVYDHEPFSDTSENEKIRQFIKGADIVVHDAQYVKEEYARHKGWGHCSFEHAVLAAADIDVKKLVLFHHEPSRTDKELEKIEKSYAKSRSPEIVLAREGMVLQA